MQAIWALAVVCALAVGARAGTTTQHTTYRHNGRVVVVDTSIEILDDLRFIGTTTRVTAGAERTLDAIATTLRGNPSIRKMEIEAFGNDLAASMPEQLALGARRAQQVVLGLVQRGVAPVRLVATGRARPIHGTDPRPLFVILVRSP